MIVIVQRGHAMNGHQNFRYLVLIGILFSFAGILLAQGAPSKILIVNGKTMGTRIVEFNGRSYVDIDTLAEITNGAVTIEPDRIVLTIRAPTPSTTTPPDQPRLSRGFASAAVSELAEMREWRGAIGTVLAYNVPVVGTWPQDYHDHTEASLSQVALTASTPADRDTLQLLRNEFANLDDWANTVVGMRQSLNATKSVDPNVMQNDQALAKISRCSSFLNAMLVSGEFSDSASCH
jgi:hypothetical protein